MQAISSNVMFDFKNVIAFRDKRTQCSKTCWPL